MPDDFRPAEIVDLPLIISQPRFSTYLRAENNDLNAALALYRWNLQLSAAFLIPLQICEVAIRNAVAETLEATYGPQWPWLKGFSLTLPVPKYGFRPRDELSKATTRHTAAGQVVADLKFVFWQYLFTSGQEARLWVPHLRTVFPNLPNSSISHGRQRIYDDVDSIRVFRNRIAHHEPIFARNIGADYERILSLIAWRSLATAEWVDRTQTVTEILARRPRPAIGRIRFQYPIR